MRADFLFHDPQVPIVLIFVAALAQVTCARSGSGSNEYRDGGSDASLDGSAVSKDGARPIQDTNDTGLDGSAVSRDGAQPIQDTSDTGLDGSAVSRDGAQPIQDTSDTGLDGSAVSTDAPQAIQASDSSVKLGLSRCIEDWPTAGGPHPMKPSLAVDAPKLLWRGQFSGSQSGDLSDGGPVLSGNRLAFQAGEWVYFVNKDGSGPQNVRYNALAAYPSALVADLAGNVYYATPDGMYSLDASGNLRWSTRSGVSTASEFASGIPPVLGPDGVVYFATLNKDVEAFRTSDGKFLWSQPGPTSKNISLARVVGGGGKALFVAYDGVYPDEQTDVFDTRDGTNLGSVINPTNGASFTWGWGAWVEGWGLGIGFGNIYVFDSCGNMSWSGSPGGAGVVAPGELLAIGTSKQASTLFLSDMAGNVLAGPAPSEGRPIAAGADGTIYTFRCQDTATSINRILAYSYDLKELWRFDLGGGYYGVCEGMTGNVVLDDDGVMYLTRPGAGGVTEAIAIQTASPGLADSSWPSLRHDNRGTAWLVPGLGAPLLSDGGNPGDVIDAPAPSTGGD